MSYKFIEAVVKVVGDENRPMNANEIWEVIKNKGYYESSGKTPE